MKLCNRIIQTPMDKDFADDDSKFAVSANL
jgi:hypothetical protein